MTQVDLTITFAVDAIQTVLDGKSLAGAVPLEIRVRPSGDDIDAIKVWIGFGPEQDAARFDDAKEAARLLIAEAHPQIAARYPLELRVETI